MSFELNGQLRLHDRMHAAVVRIGGEELPVLVVDDFLQNPAVLVDYAARHGGFEGVSDTFYPGTRAPVPPIYSFALRAFLGDAIARAFDLAGGRVTGELSHFSLVTTPPGRLSLPQRMPHFDSTNPKQLAVLHYLCDARHGGTSFYRHRSTGFEFIDEARSLAYASAVKGDLAALGSSPARYICGDDSMYQQIARFEAVFNRVLVYRSIDLHSADIQPGFHFSGDPRSGRLTANTFFYYQ